MSDPSTIAPCKPAIRSRGEIPIGKPLLLMAALGLIGAGIAFLRPAAARSDLCMWIFADRHAKAYRTIIPQFEKDTGITVDVNLLAARAETLRLMSMFLTNHRGPQVPDLCEIEINNIGPFFRAPTSDVGFLPLNGYLEKAGWIGRIPISRFAPWSKNGVIFGVPHGVHPITISFREDLFSEAGIDLASAKTWPDFRQKCLAFQRYWAAHGKPNRHAIELMKANPLDLELLILQRGINLIDDHERIHIADPKVADTIVFYAKLVAGPDPIGAESGVGMGGFAGDAQAGNICAFITPNWRTSLLKSFTPELAGKMRMMEMPKFEPTDYPTSTWGGTMIAITKASPHPDEAWKLIEFLVMSDTGMHARAAFTGIMPPVIAQWKDPIFHRPDPYYGGQYADEIFIKLAAETPPRYVTPGSQLALAQLSVVLNRTVDYLNKKGETGLLAACQGWLDETALDLAQRVEHGKFQE